MLIIRLAAAVATLGLLSSIPAAGQAPKLSSQQLNPPTSNFKPIAPPNKPITVLKSSTVALSPNGNKGSIAAPKAYSPNGNKDIAAAPPKGTLAFKRPVPCPNMRYSASANGTPDPNLQGYGGLTNSVADPTGIPSQYDQAVANRPPRDPNYGC